jgi:hypothetical protein
MKHDKTFEAIAKLKDIEIELHRLKNALEITNKALGASVLTEREACAELVLQGTEEPVQTKTLEILRKERERFADAIRARGNK